MDNFKRDEGFIELDGMQYEKEFNSYVFDINSKKYYFKKASSVHKVYNELIAEEIAKDYGIDNAKYDLASHYGYIGTISEDFNSLNNFIYMKDLINKYIEEPGLSKYNNLKDLKEILKKEYGNDELFDKLLDIFVFDVLIANSDRHNENYGLYIDNNPRFAPLFDNEYMLSNASIYTGIYSIGLTKEDYRPLIDLYSLEDDYIKKAYNQYGIYDRILDKIEIINESNMNKIIDRVENRINAKIIKPIKEDISFKMRDNYNNIYKKIKKYSLKVE